MRGLVFGVILIGCGGNGGGGGGGGGGGPVTQDQTVKACVAFAGCIGGDGINDCFTDVIPTLAPSTIECLANSGNVCSQVEACMGLAILADPQCTPGSSCQGDSVVECADGASITQDCGQVDSTGPSCLLTSTGRATCGVSSCSADARTCTGTVASVCKASLGVLQERDCAEFGLECTNGVCTSPGGGGACTSGSPHCNGTAIESCSGGTTVLFDCATRIPGSTCQASATDAYCGASTPDCFPDKGAETCSGTSLTFCAAGTTTTVDCAAIGFTSCFAGGSGGRCT